MTAVCAGLSHDIVRRHCRRVNWRCLSWIADCGLYVIGSSMNGFGSSSSDMDLCLMLSHAEVTGFTSHLMFTLTLIYLSVDHLNSTELLDCTIHIYIARQWRNFFILLCQLFSCHDVGQVLKMFVIVTSQFGKIVIIRTFPEIDLILFK